MAYELRDNSGSVFRNEEKRPDKQDADFKGKAMIGGVNYFCDLWINETKDGKKYFSFKFKEMQKQGGGGGGQGRGPTSFGRGPGGQSGGGQRQGGWNRGGGGRDDGGAPWD